MRSYVSATLVKTSATRSVFSDSVTVWNPKCVSRSEGRAVVEEDGEAALCWACGCGDNGELVVEKARDDGEAANDEDAVDEDDSIALLQKNCLFVGFEARRHRTACRGAAILSPCPLLSCACRERPGVRYTAKCYDSACRKG